MLDAMAVNFSEAHNGSCSYSFGHFVVCEAHQTTMQTAPTIIGQRGQAKNGETLGAMNPSPGGTSSRVEGDARRSRSTVLAEPTVGIVVIRALLPMPSPFPYLLIQMSLPLDLSGSVEHRPRESTVRFAPAAV